MTQQLLEQSLGALACEIPGATRVFHAFNLDFCCGGQLSLRVTRVVVNCAVVSDANGGLLPGARLHH